MQFFHTGLKCVVAAFKLGLEKEKKNNKPSSNVYLVVIIIANGNSEVTLELYGTIT